jgi:uncharacterized protein YbjQ (UPF0145 family)
MSYAAAQGFGDDAAPDVVEARLERLRGERVWSSGSSVQEFAAAEIAGFDPVGRVFGGSVFHLGFASSRARCSGTSSYAGRTDLATARGPFNTLLRLHYGARRLVVQRALAECTALGGDGIIGARLRIEPHPAGGTAFSLEGTAVRARSRTRPSTPFGAHISGQELARLMHAGWFPCALVFGIAIGSRHDNYFSLGRRRLAFRGAGNVELSSFTQLVNDVRRDARNQLGAAVAARGGLGVAVDEMTLRIGERECPTNEGQHDRVADASFTGTALIALDNRRRAQERRPLTIMHLDPARESPAEHGAGEVIERAEETSVADRLSARRSARLRRNDVYQRGNQD